MPLRRHQVLVRDRQAEERPGGRAARERRVLSRASASARSAVSVTIAFTFGFTRAICARCAWTTSVTDTSRARIRRASSTAVEKQRSLLMGPFPLRSCAPARAEIEAAA